MTESARPYICRFKNFNRFTCPSVAPLLQGCRMASYTAASSRFRLRAKFLSSLTADWQHVSSQVSHSLADWLRIICINLWAICRSSAILVSCSNNLRRYCSSSSSSSLQRMISQVKALGRGTAIVSFLITGFVDLARGDMPFSRIHLLTNSRLPVNPCLQISRHN